jgi:hypothetical protein
MLLRVLIIIICILYIVRYVFKLLLPAIFRSVINNAQQNAAQQHNYSQPQKPEGRIKVDYIPEGNKQKVPDSEGDFVDYEEIK